MGDPFLDRIAVCAGIVRFLTAVWIMYAVSTGTVQVVQIPVYLGVALLLLWTAGIDPRKVGK